MKKQQIDYLIITLLEAKDALLKKGFLSAADTETLSRIKASVFALRLADPDEDQESFYAVALIIIAVLNFALGLFIGLVF